MNKQYNADLDDYIEVNLEDDVVHPGIATDNPKAFEPCLLNEMFKESMEAFNKIFGDRDE